MFLFIFEFVFLFALIFEFTFLLLSLFVFLVSFALLLFVFLDTLFLLLLIFPSFVVLFIFLTVVLLLQVINKLFSFLHSFLILSISSLLSETRPNILSLCSSPKNLYFSQNASVILIIFFNPTLNSFILLTYGNNCENNNSDNLNFILSLISSEPLNICSFVISG